MFEGAAPDLHLLSTWPLEAHDGDVRARFAVDAGDTGALVLESGPLLAREKSGGTSCSDY